MKPFLYLNLAIMVLIGITLVLTTNPLALFGLFFLQNMPYEPDEEGEEIDATTPIGFIHSEDWGRIDATASTGQILFTRKLEAGIL